MKTIVAHIFILSIFIMPIILGLCVATSDLLYSDKVNLTRREKKIKNFFNELTSEVFIVLYMFFVFIMGFLSTVIFIIINITNNTK